MGEGGQSAANTTTDGEPESELGERDPLST
jgi:hypothetical protein